MNYIIVVSLNIENGEYHFKIQALNVVRNTFVIFSFTSGDPEITSERYGSITSDAQTEYFMSMKSGAIEIAHKNQIASLPEGNTSIRCDEDIRYIANQIRRLVNQGKGYGRNDAELYVLNRFVTRFNAEHFDALINSPAHQKFRIDKDAITFGDDSCEKRAELFGTPHKELTTVLW